MPVPKSAQPRFTLRIPHKKIDKLRYIANIHSRSANKEIEVLITEHIKAFEKEYGEITDQSLHEYFNS